ncbi:Stigma-specific Stig1 family protein [Prunus dulcis]|uniref:Stigma-specific Stig1 family protein n=1 Tax=Prunus dulcis TaxID=3755 RepID=A0A4Y1R940_PRUDU|nr:stigma-specific STIG1-like protein 1 [Prunus dulcis]KAI5330855.1 hypothetical protein L3X38_020981 [Prunus dulcis]BBH00714.1 Stigma-specific Stig1 family protein [Prunus dulcis]
MKGFKVFLMLAMLIASAITTLSAIPDEEESFFSEENNAMDETKNQLGKSTSLRSRFLASRPPAITCDKYSKLCQVSGSAGPDCCNKKCVDRNTDTANCGKCGRKCNYAEICCEGKCVNPNSDNENCGSCNNTCKKGTSCAFGMCSYA